MSLHPLKQALLPRLPDLLAELLPAGKPSGKDFLVGDEHGEPGKSCVISMDGEWGGWWQDFATGNHGDIIDLIAVHHGPGIGAAARWAAGWIGNPALANSYSNASGDWNPRDTRWKPKHDDGDGQLPQAVYTYRSTEGDPIGYVMRYPNGKGIPLGLNRKFKRWWVDQIGRAHV